MCRRHRLLPLPLLLCFAQPEEEARPGSVGNAGLTVAAANAAASAAKAPSRRVHGVSPGGCSGSPGTAPSSARPPHSAPAPPPPRPAHCRRPPQPKPAHAHPPSPRLARRALPPPRSRLAGHVADRSPSSPAPSPVVECVESKRLGAGRVLEPRACALGRPGLRTVGGGVLGVGSEGVVGVVEGTTRAGWAVVPYSWCARMWKP